MPAISAGDCVSSSNNKSYKKKIIKRSISSNTSTNQANNTCDNQVNKNDSNSNNINNNSTNSNLNSSNNSSNNSNCSNNNGNVLSDELALVASVKSCNPGSSDDVFVPPIPDVAITRASKKNKTRIKKVTRKKIKKK